MNNPQLERPLTPALAARKRMLQGYVLWKQQRLADAQTALAEAADEAKRADANDVATETAMVRARVSTAQQRWRDNEAFLKQAFDLAKANGDLYQQAAALLNLGVVEIYRFRHDHALPILQRSMILASQANAHLIRAAAAGNTSLCHSRMGNYDLAIQARQQSLAIQRQAGIRQHVVAGLGELGRIYLDEENPREAAKWFREAITEAHDLRLRNEEGEWTGALAEALVESGDTAEAARFNDAALQFATELKNTAAQQRALLTRAQIAECDGDDRGAAAAYRQLLASTEVRPRHLWTAHTGLARIYTRARQRRLAHQHYEQALSAIDRTRSELLRTDYKLGFLSALIRFHREYVDDLLRGGESLPALRVVESSRAQLLSARSRLEIQPAEVTAGREWTAVAASNNGVILSYWLAPMRSRLWVITPKEVRRFDLPGEKEIAGLVESHRQAIERELRDPVLSASSPARELYRILIAPAAALIPRGMNVFVVPDGALHNLNFETLIVAGPAPHYWLEDATVAIAPSITALAGPARAPSSSQASVLLVGDPVMADTAFEKLPFAAEEIDSISKRLRSTNPVVRTGAQATPSAFFAAAPQRFSVIHFAAHAIANRESPLDSAIILSPQGGDYKLYSRDIASSSLRADLVTISGCRSAGARAYAGEGLVGFAWAFLQAGARNVIAGLWDVSDRSTAELMDRMYEEIARGAPSAVALRRAKLDFVRKPGNFRKPYYWAAFQLFTRGDASRALYASQKTYSH